MLNWMEPYQARGRGVFIGSRLLSFQLSILSEIILKRSKSGVHRESWACSVVSCAVSGHSQCSHWELCFCFFLCSGLLRLRRERRDNRRIVGCFVPRSKLLNKGCEGSASILLSMSRAAASLSGELLPTPLQRAERRCWSLWSRWSSLAHYSATDLPPFFSAFPSLLCSSLLSSSLLCSSFRKMHEMQRWHYLYRSSMYRSCVICLWSMFVWSWFHEERRWVDRWVAAFSWRLLHFSFDAILRGFFNSLVRRLLECELAKWPVSELLRFRFFFGSRPSACTTSMHFRSLSSSLLLRLETQECRCSFGFSVNAKSAIQSIQAIVRPFLLGCAQNAVLPQFQRQTAFSLSHIPRRSVSLLLVLPILSSLSRTNLVSVIFISFQRVLNRVGMTICFVSPFLT